MKRSMILFTCFIAGTITFAQDKKEKAPPPPPPPPPKVELVKFVPPATEMNEFYKRNPSVADAYWNNKQNLVIKLKNNTKEEYDLSDEKNEECIYRKIWKSSSPTTATSTSAREIMAIKIKQV
ncbi:MAG: hypothetical protein WDO19_13340 [Bacteroidota bacterium]